MPNSNHPIRNWGVPSVFRGSVDLGGGGRVSIYVYKNVYIYIYMSPIPFGLMRLGLLSSIINTQANFCYTILIFAYNNRNETTHQTHGIYYILYARYRILHTIHYISYIIYIYIWGFSLN